MLLLLVLLWLLLLLLMLLGLLLQDFLVVAPATAASAAAATATHIHGHRYHGKALVSRLQAHDQGACNTAQFSTWPVVEAASGLLFYWLISMN